MTKSAFSTKIGTGRRRMKAAHHSGLQPVKWRVGLKPGCTAVFSQALKGILSHETIYFNTL